MTPVQNMTPVVEIAIEHAAWEEALPEVENLAREVVGACVQDLALDLPPQSEVSLLLCDDKTIRALNAAWRNQDKPTNVLSFPASRGVASPLLGDIALAFETVSAEAQTDGGSLRNHTAHLIAHGFLHLFGFDHETDEEAEIMEARERAILARLSIPDPYAARDVEPR